LFSIVVFLCEMWRMKFGSVIWCFLFPFFSMGYDEGAHLNIHSVTIPLILHSPIQRGRKYQSRVLMFGFQPLRRSNSPQWWRCDKQSFRCWCWTCRKW
jgi:hypothetical protein